MKHNRLITGIVVALALATASSPLQVSYAATEQAGSSATAVPTTEDKTVYTADEQAQIQAFQQKYAQLTDSDNSIYNLFQTEPNLTDPFDIGVLNPRVITRTVDWINYYRSLSGLPAIDNNANSNNLAQIASAVMAAAQSDPQKDQHGLKNTTQPDSVSALNWNKAVLGTNESNLYFGYPTSLGSMIKALMLDNTNISGLDAGHRAWFLSPYLSKVGVGLAIAQNGRHYESVLVNNPPDANRTPSTQIINYPANGLFPVEELVGSQSHPIVPWSISFAKGSNLVDDNTTITVTNLTNGTTGTVSPSYYGSQAYSETFLSFAPPTNVTINDHSEYKVTVSGLKSDSMTSYSYTFKTFSENATENVTNSK
ncbi:CAP domain-containing protein [Companilactobacillus sp.]|jgi:hypothetical protein|uniref:CAP domain-containing protein n=1 Tax=Companilactobacillus sp. TaxID=2767905 RepID=UPI0025BF550D|nr:CAP domain-containing protein [Companilactobacillus sp.]MCH4008993.1 CAP domain-containing protein [Companilactobacillus sp.]MCH4050828.1 CAP domain-containing protein [Companilactobacillus sp.]MCH4076936.1 CAP domain-containing protein [Companilactobacillus sp.]MCH4125511.1 CAP domain-containing protein [Companilactobacillus sp.]MCI1311220.1 CAP domain-containing protein [Companilactobacillus sp.]